MLPDSCWLQVRVAELERSRAAMARELELAVKVTEDVKDKLSIEKRRSQVFCYAMVNVMHVCIDKLV